MEKDENSNSQLIKIKDKAINILRTIGQRCMKILRVVLNFVINLIKKFDPINSEAADLLKKIEAIELNGEKIDKLGKMLDTLLDHIKTSSDEALGFREYREIEQPFASKMHLKYAKDDIRNTFEVARMDFENKLCMALSTTEVIISPTFHHPELNAVSISELSKIYNKFILPNNIKTAISPTIIPTISEAEVDKAFMKSMEKGYKDGIVIDVSTINFRRILKDLKQKEADIGKFIDNLRNPSEFMKAVQKPLELSGTLSALTKINKITADTVAIYGAFMQFRVASLKVIKQWLTSIQTTQS